VSSSQPVIQVHNLAKHYGPVRAVDGIDITVTRGEIYALLGLNGAGKTTTIRMLLGMIKPTAGVVSLLGRPVAGSRADLWADVGYLVETPAAYPELTVAQNLHLAARLRKLTSRDAVDAVIADLGLTACARRRAGDLSLGNQQRLGLAKAFIHRPALLILDEPANGLDPAGVVEIRLLLQTLATRGTTVLLSSHILAEVARLATRIGVIHNGRMITELATADLPAQVHRQLSVSARDPLAAAEVLRSAGHDPITGTDHRLVLTGQQAREHPEDVATLLVHAGHPPTHLAIDEEDLESFFLRLTGPEASS
jgi:ABC-2 type transport system ATP-binding protein